MVSTDYISLIRTYGLMRPYPHDQQCKGIQCQVNMLPNIYDYFEIHGHSALLLTNIAAAARMIRAIMTVHDCS